VGTTGDVVPFAALAEALAARGHAVTAVAWELYRAAFEEAGVAFVAAGPATTMQDIAATAARAAAVNSPLAQVAVLRDFHLREAGAHYRALRDALQGHDLVLMHGVHTLAEAASRDAGLRYATAVFDPVLLPTSTGPPAGFPSLGIGNRLAWWVLDRMLRRQDGPLHAALEGAGSPSAGAVTMFRARSPLLHLVAVSRIIAPPPSDLDDATQFTGAWFRQSPSEPLPAAVDEFLSAGPPPVVVTFGSMAVDDRSTLLGKVAAGIRAAGQRALVQDAGHAGGTSEDGGTAWIGRVDHRALFPRALAVVHHGGAGTSQAVAAAGRPSVVVPHVGDQPFWAARLSALGVAARPLALEDVTATAVEQRIRAVVAPEVGHRSERLGMAIRAEDGIGSAIGLLEEAATG
jgi:UDP:flavonoid glycosyltransferase YjiC (YdhE family)